MIVFRFIVSFYFLFVCSFNFFAYSQRQCFPKWLSVPIANYCIQGIPFGKKVHTHTHTHTNCGSFSLNDDFTPRHLLCTMRNILACNNPSLHLHQPTRITIIFALQFKSIEDISAIPMPFDCTKHEREREREKKRMKRTRKWEAKKN